MFQRAQRTRRLLLVAIVLATVLITTQGCATNGDGWDSRITSTPLPAYFVEVPQGQITRYCGSYARLTVHGCAHRDYASSVCLIYHEPDAPIWLLAHEALHCAGLNHSYPT